MIKAEDVRYLTLNSLEEKCKKQLSVVEKYIADACEKGKMEAHIWNAAFHFSNLDDLGNLLRMRYGYRIRIHDGELHIYWDQLKTNCK